MARQNRRDIFDPNEVDCLHAVQRTVCRALVCGSDTVSGKSFEHRPTWIQNRVQELVTSFGIESLAQEAILRGRPRYRTGSSPLPSVG